MVVNRALAYKWCGEDKIAKNIIYQEDWSASMAKFRLAEAIIHDNFDEAYKIMFEIGVNQNEVNKSNYRDWPLFKAIKKKSKFLEVFQEIFGEPYNKFEQIDTELPEDTSINSSTLAPETEECKPEESL